MKRFSLPRAGTLLLCLALLAGLLSGCALPASPQGLALSAMAAPLAAAVFPLSSGLPQVQADAGSGTLPCYYDSASGVCYYVCEDLCKASPTEYTYTLRAFSVRDGKIHTQTLATRTVFYSVSGQPYTSYRDFSGNPMTESDYIGYADRYFSQCTSVLLSPDGSLAAPGQPAQTSTVPAPVPVPVTTPIPTPAPTPAPVPTSYSGPAPAVTKNPTNESLSVGGTTWFIAHAVNASKLTWQAVSPNGLVYTLSEALSLHPGLSLETEANDTLALRNVPFSLNGWGFQARFEGPGGVALSSVAYIFVADYITAYQGVLSAYRAAYQTGGHSAQYAVSNNLSVMIAHSPHVGYAFKDLDKDGTPELFIAGLGTDPLAQSVVYDIYALVNGTPRRLAVSTENDRYYLCTDNSILNSGSEGASHTYAIVYRFANDSIAPVESYISCTAGSPKDGYYYQVGAYSPEPRPGDTQLTESMFRARVREREAKVFQLIYTQIA